MTGSELLKELKKRGISQAEIARVLGLERSQINKVTKSRQKLQIPEMEKIQDYFAQIDSTAVKPISTKPLETQRLDMQELHLSGFLMSSQKIILRKFGLSSPSCILSVHRLDLQFRSRRPRFYFCGWQPINLELVVIGARYRFNPIRSTEISHRLLMRSLNFKFYGRTGYSQQ